MNWRSILPYWGLVSFVVALTGWLTSDIGPAGLSVLFALAFLRFLFQAPIPCGAPIRIQGESCRKNVHGLLRGCHYEQHKWQRLHTLVVRPQLRRTGHELFGDPKVGLASIGAIVALLSTLVTTTMTVLGKGGSWRAHHHSGEGSSHKTGSAFKSSLERSSNSSASPKPHPPPSLPFSTLLPRTSPPLVLLLSLLPRL